ncbi:hypothetical protein ACS0TY_034810 [Phlomoides rotata]
MAAAANFISNLPMAYGVSMGSTLKRPSFGIGGVKLLSHHKAAASFPMMATSSQREKRSPSVRVSCVSEAQNDGGKFRDGQGSMMAGLAFSLVAYMFSSHLERVVPPVIKVFKAYFTDLVKCIQLHSIPVHIAVAVGVALVVSLTLVTAGVFIGYLLAGSPGTGTSGDHSAGNPGTGTSALLSIGNININTAICGGKIELPLPQDKASTGPVDAVNNLGLSPEQLVQILLKLTQ